MKIKVKSVKDSIEASSEGSVWYLVRDSVLVSVWHSVWVSMIDSVSDSIVDFTNEN